MDVSIYCLRPIVLVFFFQITVASAHVFETEDAIVITGNVQRNDKRTQMTVTERNKNYYSVSSVQ